MEDTAYLEDTSPCKAIHGRWYAGSGTSGELKKREWVVGQRVGKFQMQGRAGTVFLLSVVIIHYRFVCQAKN